MFSAGILGNRPLLIIKFIDKVKENHSNVGVKTASFDLHDTILVFKFGGQAKQNKIFRAVLYFLSNFRLFVFIYTFFCQRNEKIINLMEKLKFQNNRVIVLTSTNQKCAKVIYYFLKKNSIGHYDEIIFRKEFWQKESDYKIEEIQKNNIHLHYDDGVEVCAKMNKIKSNSCVIVGE